MAADTREKLGTVEDIVIDPENGKILCFIVNTGLFKTVKIIAPDDLIGWENEFLISQMAANLLEKKEIIRANDLIEQKLKIIEQKVVNQQMRTIGRVSDVTINLETFQLNRLAVEINPLKGIMESERLIPWDKIIKITKKFIMVKELEKDKATVVKKFAETT